VLYFPFSETSPYNSKLARIINEQGKPQLGKAKSDCSGFTPEELSLLDFSRIDFTEFINDVKQNVTVPDTSSLQSTVQQKTQSKIQNYYNNKQ
jgi:conjugal transfer mating pair stabilization protein TraN